MKNYKFKFEATSRYYLYEYQAERNEVVNIIENGNYMFTLCNNKLVTGPYASSKATREIHCIGVPIW